MNPDEVHLSSLAFALALGPRKSAQTWGADDDSAPIADADTTAGAA